MERQKDLETAAINNSKTSLQDDLEHTVGKKMSYLIHAFLCLSTVMNKVTDG